MSEHNRRATLISRRDALSKLAKLAAYSTPAVSTLLSPHTSHAAGSAIPPETSGCSFNGSHFNGLLGANNNANVVEGDASNEPRVGNVRGDDFRRRNPDGDHARYFESFGEDNTADCGK